MKDRIKKLWKREPRRIKWDQHAPANSQSSSCRPVHSNLGVSSYEQPGSSNILSSLYAEGVPRNESKHFQDNREVVAHGDSGNSPEHTTQEIPTQGYVPSPLTVKAVTALSGVNSCPETAQLVRNLLKGHGAGTKQVHHTHAEDGSTAGSKSFEEFAGATGAESCQQQDSGTALLLRNSAELESTGQFTDRADREKHMHESGFQDPKTGVASSGLGNPCADAGGSAPTSGGGRGNSSGQTQQQACPFCSTCSVNYTRIFTEYTLRSWVLQAHVRCFFCSFLSTCCSMDDGKRCHDRTHCRCMTYTHLWSHKSLRMHSSLRMHRKVNAGGASPAGPHCSLGTEQKQHETEQETLPQTRTAYQSLHRTLRAQNHVPTC